jgi:hypothetical protein
MKDLPSRLMAATACVLAGIAVALTALTLIHGAPRGLPGPQGPQGAQGITGAQGPAAPVLPYVCQELFPDASNGNTDTTFYFPCTKNSDG